MERKNDQCPNCYKYIPFFCDGGNGFASYVLKHVIVELAS